MINITIPEVQPTLINANVTKAIQTGKKISNLALCSYKIKTVCGQLSEKEIQEVTELIRKIQLTPEDIAWCEANGISVQK